MNNFFSKLKGIGAGVVKFGIPVAEALAPAIPGGGAIAAVLNAISGTGNVSGTLGKIGSVVGLVERLFVNVGAVQGGGAKKLQAAAPFVEEIVKDSELVSGHQIKDASLFAQGCQKIINGVVDILNSQDAGVPAPAVAPAPVAAAATSTV